MHLKYRQGYDICFDDFCDHFNRLKCKNVIKAVLNASYPYIKFQNDYITPMQFIRRYRL